MMKATLHAKPRTHLLRRLVVVSIACITALIAAPRTHAQSKNTGSISGRVLNGATGEYFRNAEVWLAGSHSMTATDDNGRFRLVDVPAGPATIEVHYTGYVSGRESVVVVAGQDTVRNIELVSSASTGAKEDSGVITLGVFTVSTEREGNAKAIMDQRNSMNITNTVASDVFGDNAEGNVGDFLRNMPGIDLELTQGEVRNVRLRGLGSEYNSVTIDGVSLASADANSGAAGNARAFSFEQVSLASMDAIEVSKTISADVDANAPAGTINLKTKHAFSREGRRVSMQANVMAFADEWHLRKTFGPDDVRRRKINPGGIFEYSDVLLDKRLGVVLNILESNLYSENARSIVTYNYTPTATDPRPVVPTQIQFLHAPRLNRRSTVTLTTDFKATPNLVFSLRTIYNYAFLNNVQRNLTLNAGPRSAIVGDDPLTRFVSGPTGTVTVNPNVVVKPGETVTVMPFFEYKRGAFSLDGKFAGSISTSWYDPLGHVGSPNNPGSPSVSGVSFLAERSTPQSSDWRIVQTAGPDIAQGNRFTAPTFGSNDGRYNRNQFFSGDVQASLRTNWRLPVAWKAGVKHKREIRDYEVRNEAKRYNYTGPGAGTGALASIPSPYSFDLDALDASVASSSGKPVFVPNMQELGRLFRERPDLFTHSMTATNYYNAFIGNDRHFQEDISAAFLMATATAGRALVRAGMRYERTGTDALEFDPRSAAEVVAAGFQERAGRATTIEGLDYQYFTKPKVHRKGSYDNFFPSASLKYKFTRNFDLHLGYSSTIRRATIRDLAGVWSIDDDSFSVTAPNPRLQPETSDNYSARLAYYFEPVGLLAVNVFENSIKGLHRTSEVSAAEFGNTNPELEGYRFITSVVSEEKVVNRGMELEYSQSLSFLPRPFKGLTVRTSYTRTYADVVVPSMSPHAVNGGFHWALGLYTVYASANWRDDTPLNTAHTSWVRHRTTVDVGGSVKLSRRFSLFFTGRNLASEPVVSMQRSGSNPPLAQTIEVTGAIWSFGIKGVF